MVCHFVYVHTMCNQGCQNMMAGVLIDHHRFGASHQCEWQISNPYPKNMYIYMNIEGFTDCQWSISELSKLWCGIWDRAFGCLWMQYTLCIIRYTLYVTWYMMISNYDMICSIHDMLYSIWYIILYIILYTVHGTQYNVSVIVWYTSHRISNP